MCVQLLKEPDEMHRPGCRTKGSMNELEKSCPGCDHPMVSVADLWLAERRMDLQRIMNMVRSGKMGVFTFCWHVNKLSKLLQGKCHATIELLVDYPFALMIWRRQFVKLRKEPDYQIEIVPLEHHFLRTKN